MTRNVSALPVDHRGGDTIGWSGVGTTLPLSIAGLVRDAASRGLSVAHPLVATLLSLVSRMTSESTVTIGLSSRALDVLLHRPLASEQSRVHALSVTVERSATCRDLEASITAALTEVAGSAAVDALLPPLPIVLDWRSPGPQGDLPSGCEASQLVATVAVDHDADAVVIEMAYDGALFVRDTIESLALRYGRLLAGALAAPMVPMSQIPLLTSAERDHAIHDRNQTGVTRLEPQLVHERFEAQVTRSPSAVAASSDQETLTYRELDRRAERLAQVLVARGVGAESMVGLSVTRSLNLLVAMLAILKAGGAFVPLDPELPAPRIAFILRDTGMSLVLVDTDTEVRMAEVGPSVSRLRVDEIPDEPPDDRALASVERLRSRRAPESLAYVIYTSGSTGQPKGVLLTDRALCNHAQWLAATVGLSAADRVLLHASISFDAAMAEIFPPLLAGATVVLAHPDAHHELNEIPRIARRERVTVMTLVPSALRVAVTSPEFARCADLRFLICGGEALEARLCHAVRAVLPAVRIGNFYGPSEATIDATSFVGGDELPDAGPIPIGKPIANAVCHVLDDRLEPLPTGWIGELCVGGVGVARGYLNHPELTARRFVADPFRAGERLYRTGDRARYLSDGNLVYVGRADAQVKVRGYRIELGEVEQALLHTGSIAQAAVVPRVDRDGDTQLVAYIVPSAGTACRTAELRESLARSLPAWMVPGMFVPLERLPLTINGKLDLRALPDPAEAVDDSSVDESFVDPIERGLLGIWRRTLALHTIQPDDDFFALGGHSLKVFRLLAEIEKSFDVSLRATSVFGSATIRTLANRIRDEQEREVWTI